MNKFVKVHVALESRAMILDSLKDAVLTPLVDSLCSFSYFSLIYLTY